MKVAIICQSPLLEQSLKLFLKEYLESYKKSDFVITDKIIDDINKPQFIISFDRQQANLAIPFGKTTLMIALKKFYQAHKVNLPKKDIELQIEELLKEYTTKLMTIIKENR